MKKKQVFICDSCGTKVGNSTDKCPSCGKHFKGVRCPQCMYSGKNYEFKNGCPVCGYLADSEEKSEEPFYPAEKKKRELPMWFYLGTIFFLLLALGIILFLFAKM